MKPLVLKMKAFLGFKEETIIDFKALYEDKIFLITGPTGSGKTSIFDAVAYALYGEGSGETRTKAKCFRSQMAKEKEKMEVDLEFEVQGVLYHVHREENHRGINKAVFYKASDPETMWTKIRDVNQEVETIIGLNLDQFKKIVMIPQGEFREFLTAGTKDKSDILKKLFATEQYEVFQRKIKETFDGVKAKDQELRRRFSQVILDVGLEEKDIEQGPDPLKEELEKQEIQLEVLKKEDEIHQKKVKALDLEIQEAKYNNEEFKKFQKAKENYQRLEEKKPEIEIKKNMLQLLRKVSKVAAVERELSQKERDVQTYKTDLEKLAKERKILADQMVTLNKKWIEAKEEEKTLDEKKERRNKLKDFIEKSNQMEKVNKTLGHLTKERDQVQKQLDNLKLKKEEVEHLQSQREKAQEEFHHIQMMLSSLKLTHHEKEGQLKTYRDLYQKNKRRESLERKLETLEKEEKSVANEVVKAQKEQEIEEENRNQSYALVLREELKDEEPCPVCGSLHHPLNVNLGEHYDQEKLKKVNSRLKELEGKQIEVRSEIKSAITTYKELVEEIQELNKDGLITLTSSEALKEMGLNQKDEVKKVKEEQESRSKDLDIQKNLGEELTKKIEDVKKLLKEEEGVVKEKSRLDEDINGYMGELRSLRSQGTPEDTHLMKTELSTLEKTIAHIEAQGAKAQKDKDEAQEKDHTLAGRESAVQKNLEQGMESEKILREEFYDALENEELKRETYQAHRGKLSEMDKLEDVTRQFDRVYYEKKGIYESLREEGEKRVELALEPLLESLSQANKAQEEKQKELKAKEFLTLNLSNAHKRLGETHLEYEKNKKELETIQNLHDTANTGMGFETFVQSYYFEGILLRANQRLKKMSEGRYQLRRRNETENRREKIGLGLNVFDEYSGSERDVLSLSGGEGFKASLSLALGLSDFIESHKGSVNLETIFIDEGFGSLDQDSLDNALECLLELNVSGRIVGIISHVTELKDRIPGKIEVNSKPGQGSRIKVNGGIN